jgi:hypothetical protein
MFIDMTAVHMMQMSVVQVVDMSLMLNGPVPAIGPMLMSMVGVNRTIGTHMHLPCRSPLKVVQSENDCQSDLLALNNGKCH